MCLCVYSVRMLGYGEEQGVAIDRERHSGVAA